MEHAEAVATATKALRDELEKQTAEVRRELSANLETQIKDLEKRINAGEEAGKGVAELKQEHDNRSQANAEFVAKIEDMVQKHADTVNERMAEIEKAAKRGGGRQIGTGMSLGQGLAKAVSEAGMGAYDADKRASYKLKGEMPLLRKDIAISANTVIEPTYVPGIIGPGERTLYVRDLLPRNRTTSVTVFFVKETSLTDNAAPQSALGQAKGESTFTLTVDSETVQTIAHFIQVPTQLLDDIPALEDYTNSRMLFMLGQEEEDQLLYGNDTGVNLNGLMTQATAYDTTLVTELSVSNNQDLDALRLAIAQVQVAQYPPSGIVMHPYNWANLELLKDSQARYLFAMPQDRTVPRMWGLPVVATTAMTSPDFLVGAFSLGAAIWDRMESQIAISTEDSDNFQKNLATIRAEERITLTVYRPAAFVQGDFSATVT